MLYYEGNSLRNLPVYHNCVLMMFLNLLVFSCLILRSGIVMLSKTDLVLQLSAGKGSQWCMVEGQATVGIS